MTVPAIVVAVAKSQHEELVDWNAVVPISKIQGDRQFAFGWASVVTLDDGTTPIVDVDEKTPNGGDVIMPETIELAAYRYVEIFRGVSDLHTSFGVAQLIESVVLTAEKREAMGLPSGRVGWWVGFHVTDPDVWALVKSGKRPMLSIRGKARRRPYAG